MDNAESLQRTLRRARRALQILEEEKVGYGIRIPVDLQIEFEEKQKEVASLEARLAQLQGGTSNSVPDNLPRYSSVFVGRKREIEQCLEALAPEERGWGVAIDGIGGMGKTALALEVAYLAREQAMFDAYLFASAKTTWLSPEGVRQETLALSSLDAFCREFARILGQDEIVRMSDARERRRALLDALRGRRVLLIWDNLETLTKEERNQIAEFLRKLPTPNKAIITSRRRTGESALTIRLDQLSWEEAADMMRQLGQRQFRVERALQQAGVKGQQELYDVAGGNPLALDWTLGLIAQKGYSFNTALKLLRNAAFSSDLYGFLFADAVRDLAATDRTLLSVFVVFFTPATVAALGDVTGLSPTEIRSGLDRLVTLSLVNDLEGERYGLHPLTRNYVTVALGGTPAGTATPTSATQLDANAQRKALRYWVDYAQKYGGSGKDAYKTYDKLEAEWQNLEGIANTLRELSGIPGTLQDREAAQMLIDLENALIQFLWFRGYWDEYIRLGEWRYQAGKGLGKWSDAGWGAFHAAMTHYHRAETDQAAIWADRMTAAMERGGSRYDRATAAQMQGNVAQQRRDWAEAERWHQDALAAYRELGEEEGEANTLNWLGVVAHQQQQYDRAETYYQQALAIAEKLDLKEPQAYISSSLGRLALDRDRPQEARLWYERELTLAQEVGRQDKVAYAQAGLAQVLEAEGRYSEALELAQQALQIRERLRDGNVAYSRGLVERLQQRVSS
ncbi:MAG: tetratricopeptide repeat protein [Calothrix sp. MO_192.B10]|nr:tetratricopeptide repeat protein [Calothrix sp. MO_192.B10]